MEAAKLSTRLLPGDVVVDIMARLPVKSLRRFRSVAKCWCTLIQSREFISAHCSHSKNKLVRPLIMHGIEREEKTVVSLLSNTQTSFTDLDVVTSLDIPYFTPRTMDINMLGYCNGILCFADSRYGSKSGTTCIALWNIATKEFKIIPPCSVEQQSIWFKAMGFGYDSQRDDYKVVAIYTLFDYMNTPQFIHSRVALYSLATDSWRSVDATFKCQFSTVRNERVGVYTNGFYHFWGFGDDVDKQLLLSFDFSKEVFTTTPFPDALHFCGFMEIYGSLGMLGLQKYYDDHFPSGYVADDHFDVWVLGEIGVSNSWAKLFNTAPIPHRFCNVVGAGSNGELFFARDGEFLVCHPHPSNPSKQVTSIPTLQALGSSLALQMYAESLVSLS